MSQCYQKIATTCQQVIPAPCMLVQRQVVEQRYQLRPAGDQIRKELSEARAKYMYLQRVEQEHRECSAKIERLNSELAQAKGELAGRVQQEQLGLQLKLAQQKIQSLEGREKPARDCQNYECCELRAKASHHEADIAEYKAKIRQLKNQALDYQRQVAHLKESERLLRAQLNSSSRERASSAQKGNSMQQFAQLMETIMGMMVYRSEGRSVRADHSVEVGYREKSPGPCKDAVPRIEFKAEVYDSVNRQIKQLLSHSKSEEMNDLLASIEKGLSQSRARGNVASPEFAKLLQSFSGSRTEKRVAVVSRETSHARADARLPPRGSKLKSEAQQSRCRAVQKSTKSIKQEDSMGYSRQMSESRESLLKDSRRGTAERSSRSASSETDSVLRASKDQSECGQMQDSIFSSVSNQSKCK